MRLARKAGIEWHRLRNACTSTSSVLRAVACARVSLAPHTTHTTVGHTTHDRSAPREVGGHQLEAAALGGLLEDELVDLLLGVHGLEPVAFDRPLLGVVHAPAEQLVHRLAELARLVLEDLHQPLVGHLVVLGLLLQHLILLCKLCVVCVCVVCVLCVV